MLDHISQKNLTLKNIDYLVLDEADRMLDMGFMPDVKKIIQQCPEKRHTSLFSATIPPIIETIIQWAMTDPETVEIGMRRSVAETVSHAVYPVAFDQKNDLVLALLDKVNYDSVIVFCRTKVGADRLGSLLKRENHSVAILHSNRTQAERERSLNGFRDGKYGVLVATDIASRGLDVANVSHVVNFDVPQHPEDYVHRIGRTGRAAASGDAFTMMVAEDRQHMEAIERFIGKISFCHGFRTCLRSLLSVSYRWLQEGRGRGLKSRRVPARLRAEIFAVTLLLPFTQFSLKDEW